MATGKLTPGQLVLMGKGPYAALKPIGNKPYQGGVGPIVDQAQSELNRKAGYWSP